MYQTTWHIYLEPQKNSILPVRSHVGTIHKKRGVYYFTSGEINGGTPDTDNWEDQMQHALGLLCTVYEEQAIRKNCYIAIIES